MIDVWGSLVNPDDRQKPFQRLFSWWSRSDDRHAEKMKDLIKELSRVRKEVFHEYHRLNGLSIDEGKKTGMTAYLMRKRLMYLFVKDLSKGASGEVLSNKSHRLTTLTSSTRMERVSWRVKWLGWLTVLLLNGGMLFYVYLFATTQTRSRQSAWFLSFLMWLLFEIFVSSTSMVLVFHMLIPLYVLADVAKLKEKVLKDLIHLRDGYVKDATTRQTSKAGSCDFNSAKYLFTSWRVASLFPDLPESRVILQFKTLWPKKKFGQDEENITKDYEDDIILTAASQIVLFFLTSFLHCSSFFQDLIVQLICNSSLGYLCLGLLRLSSINALLPVSIVVFLFICFHFLLRQTSVKMLDRLHAIKESAIHPIQDTQANDGLFASPLTLSSIGDHNEFLDSMEDESIGEIINISVSDSISYDSLNLDFGNFLRWNSGSSSEYSQFLCEQEKSGDDDNLGSCNDELSDDSGAEIGI